jgi:hypothetical protein
MSANFINQNAYLRTSRRFPVEDQEQLSLELSRSYIDIASSVNARTISLFPTTRSAQTGENWYITQNRRQQGFRQVYQFSDSNLVINHGINFLTQVSNFVRIWGTFFDGTNWQTLPYVDVVAANNQINVKVNSTQIIITKGAGAPPAITNGLLVLEWISQP